MARTHSIRRPHKYYTRSAKKRIEGKQRLKESYKLHGMKVIYDKKKIEFVLKNKQIILDKKIILKRNFSKMESDYQTLLKKKSRSPKQSLIRFELGLNGQTPPRFVSDAQERFEAREKKFIDLSTIFVKNWNDVLQNIIEKLKNCGIVDNEKEDSRDYDDLYVRYPYS